MRFTGPGRAVLALVLLPALSAGVAAASPAGQDAYVGRHPLAGQPGTAEQVAQLVLFLASDAAGHISGTELWIDGAESLLKG